MTTPNRLETHWNELRPLLLKKWDRLTPSDLDYVDAEFDRLVELVKQRYDDPVITAKEANIRQVVLDLLAEVEKNTDAF
jgi:hypothetical protein